eukprot:5778900-Prymnesium_polylepis.1
MEACLERRLRSSRSLLLVQALVSCNLSLGVSKCLEEQRPEGVNFKAPNEQLVEVFVVRGIGDVQHVLLHKVRTPCIHVQVPVLFVDGAEAQHRQDVIYDIEELCDRGGSRTRCTDSSPSFA